MAPGPSQLKIKTSALQRLVKEEQSYHKELEQQNQSLAKAEASTPDEDDTNHAYMIEQQRRGIKETESIFEQLNVKIQAAKEDLTKCIQQSSNADPEDLENARQTLATSESKLS